MHKLKLFATLIWLVALALFAWVCQQLPLALLSQMLAQLNLVQWLSWIGLNLALILAATLRWWLFTQILGRTVRFWELLKLRQAGQALNFLTPGPQLGSEPLQIVYLWRHQHLELAKALLSLSLDRFYEVWVNLAVLLLAASILLSSAPGINLNSLQLLGMLCIGLMALTLFAGWIAHAPEQLQYCLLKIIRPWQAHPRLQNFSHHLHSLAQELKTVLKQQQAALVWGLLLSLLSWAGLLAELWLLLSFLDLPITLTSFLLILLSLRLALLLPLPGGLGSMEAALIWTFATLDFPGTSGFELIALMRLRDVLVILLGLVCLKRVKFNVLD